MQTTKTFKPYSSTVNYYFRELSSVIATAVAFLIIEKYNLDKYISSSNDISLFKMAIVIVMIKLLITTYLKNVSFYKNYEIQLDNKSITGKKSRNHNTINDNTPRKMYKGRSTLKIMDDKKLPKLLKIFFNRKKFIHFIKRTQPRCTIRFNEIDWDKSFKDKKDNWKVVYSKNGNAIYVGSPFSKNQRKEIKEALLEYNYDKKFIYQ